MGKNPKGMVNVLRLNIRTMQDDDVPQVMDIFKGWPNIFSRRELAYYEADYRTWLDGASSEDEAFYVASPITSPGTVAGTIGYKREPEADGVYQLLRFAVRKDLKGHGTGTRLLSHVEQMIRERAGRLLYTFTSTQESMGASRAFYQSIGFKVQAKLPHYWRDGEGLAILGKRLRQGAGRSSQSPRPAAYDPPACHKRGAAV